MDTRALIDQFLAAITTRDRAALVGMVHPGFVTEIPQSGEKTTGVDAFLAELEQYPGGGPEVPSATDVKLVTQQDRWAMSPAYTVVPLASPNDFIASFRVRYPDGRWWHVIGLIELRDGKLIHMENYFAPELPAPLAQSMAAWPHG